MSALDGLLGKVLTDDVEIELSEGLNFKNGMVATLNPVTNLTEVSFGAGVDHGDMQIADGIHGTFWKTFLNQTDRRAFPLIAAYVGRRALQLSDATVWDVLPVPGSNPQTYGWGLSCAGLESTFNGDFGALFTAAGFTVLDYARSDLGLTKTGSIVNSWVGQTGGITVAEGTSTVGLGGATTGANGYAGISSNASTQWGKYTLALPAPGTTPAHFWMLCRLLSTPAGFGYVDAQGTNFHTLYVNTASTDLRWQNTALIQPITMALNTWGCLETSADNTLSSYMKFGPAIELTGNPGNNASTGLRGLFAAENGAGKVALEVLARVRCTGGTVASFKTTAAAVKAQAQTFYALAGL